LSGATTHIRFFLLFFFCFISQLLLAQSLKDTLQLEGFEVKSNFLVQNPGFKKVRIDSSLLIPQINADLSTILAQHSTIFIKSYGNGSLATPSLRGTSASHTHVEWNGISINSPMLGTMDLSQAPVSQFNSIEILYGPASITQAGGAFGGIVNLVTNPDWNNKVNILVTQTPASFLSYNTSLGMGLGNQTVQSITKINYGLSANKFHYYDDLTNTTRKLNNAEYSMGGISEEAFFKFSNKYFLNARLWYNENNAKIPSLSGLNYSSQYDRALRSMIEGKVLWNKSILSCRTALVDQVMRFSDGSTPADSVYKHQVYSWTNRVKWAYSGIRNLSIKPGIDFNYDWVISDSYDTRKTRNTIGLFSEFIYDLYKKVDFTLVIRQDVIDGKFLPLIPGFGIGYRPFTKIDLSFNTNISINHRVPSLNDLYWSPYGNPDLNPETDYAAEVSLTYNLLNQTRSFFLEAELTGYYSQMKDLIQWKPVSGNSSVWRPVNVSEVLARGLEAGLISGWKSGKQEFHSIIIIVIAGQPAKKHNPQMMLLWVNSSSTFPYIP
jgi:outer membrane cobalamin receptor